jgi:predicted membrane protein
LNIKNIAGYKDLNLDNINWNKINLKWWRWDNIIKIWKDINIESEINIDLLVGRVMFKIPENVWIDLYYKGLYTSMEMIDMEPKDKWHYQSKNYNTVTQKIKIIVNLWLGTLKVDWLK